VGEWVSGRERESARARARERERGRERERESERERERDAGITLTIPIRSRFQKSGAVPKKALTLGTPSTSCVDMTSGKLRIMVRRFPMSCPQSKFRFRFRLV